MGGLCVESLIFVSRDNGMSGEVQPCHARHLCMVSAALAMIAFDCAA